MLKYKIINQWDRSERKKVYTDGFLGSERTLAKTIAIPFSTRTRNTGYSDFISELFLAEKNKIRNNIVDTETLKFKSSGGTQTTRIKFWFNDEDQGINVYENSYLAAGFTNDEISEGRNNFKNSFFRLDFYDSNNQREQNFLFSEFLYVSDTSQPNFNFDRIFYKKEDPKFTEENTFVELYFEALFFNSKTGTIQNLINIPRAPNSSPNGSLTLDQYNANPIWRFAKIKVLNPYFNSPGVGSLDRLFLVGDINGNSYSEINFSELKII